MSNLVSYTHSVYWLFQLNHRYKLEVGNLTFRYSQKYVVAQKVLGLRVIESPNLCEQIVSADSLKTEYEGGLFSFDILVTRKIN